MLNPQRLEAVLPVGGLGEPLYVFPSLGSTNDEAKAMAAKGTAHGTLIVADAQSKGRGRRDRTWYTEPGGGLAFSLVLRPKQDASINTRLTVLGALAVTECLNELGGKAWIKWPNDVVMADGKVAGVLVEASWLGDALDYVVIGIGVNVHSGSIPDQPLSFPASYVDHAVGYKVDRHELIVNILRRISYWLSSDKSKAMVQAWEEHLAYRDQAVQLSDGGEVLFGRIEGLESDGRLRLLMEDEEIKLVEAGDLSLRPIDSNED